MEALSNWVLESSLLLHEALQESHELPSGDLADILDEDKCFSLTRPHQGEVEGCCWLRLTAAPPHLNPYKTGKTKLLTAVLLFSEARVVEVCQGPHDEYLKTVHGQLAADFEDSSIFKTEVMFDDPVAAVSLKLKATCHKDSVWVFGIHVTTVVRSDMHIISRFSSDHLSSVLRNKEVHMSKEASKFRQMLEAFNDTGQAKGASNPLAFFSALMGPTINRPLQLDRDDNFNGNSNGNGKYDESYTTISNPSEKCKNLGEKVFVQENLQDIANGNKLCSSDVTQSTEREIKTNVCDQGEKEKPGVEMDKMRELKNSQLESFLPYLNNGTDSSERRKQDMLMEVLSKGAKASQSDMESKKISALGSNGQQSMEALLSIMGSLNVNQGRPLGHLAMSSLNTSATKQDLGNNKFPSSSKANGETEHLPDSLQTVIDCVGDMIDKKLAVVEERVLQKIDDRLAEQAKENAIKIEKIEKMLSEIYDKL